MNPNSAHQTWGLWVYQIRGAMHGPRVPDVVTNCRRFARKAFGSVAQLRVRHDRAQWEVRILAEGAPVEDPAVTRWIHQQWVAFLLHGFGASCVVTARARLMAGRRADGQPADQLIILPSIPSRHIHEGG